MAPESAGTDSKISSSSLRWSGAWPRVEWISVQIFSNVVRSPTVRPVGAALGGTFRKVRYSESSGRSCTTANVARYWSSNRTARDAFSRSGADSIPSGRNNSKESPIWIRSPASSMRSLTGTELTNVPFRLFKSVMLTCPASSFRITAWCRETSFSLRQTEFGVSRPMENSGSDRTKLWPFNDPARTTTVGFVPPMPSRLYRTGLTGSTVNATFGTMLDQIAPAGFSGIRALAQSTVSAVCLNHRSASWPAKTSVFDEQRLIGRLRTFPMPFHKHRDMQANRPTPLRATIRELQPD